MDDLDEMHPIFNETGDLTGHLVQFLGQTLLETVFNEQLCVFYVGFVVVVVHADYLVGRLFGVLHGELGMVVEYGDHSAWIRGILYIRDGVHTIPFQVLHDIFLELQEISTVVKLGVHTADAVGLTLLAAAGRRWAQHGGMNDGWLLGQTGPINVGLSSCPRRVVRVACAA